MWCWISLFFYKARIQRRCIQVYTKVCSTNHTQNALHSQVCQQKIKKKLSVGHVRTHNDLFIFLSDFKILNSSDSWKEFLSNSAIKNGRMAPKSAVCGNTKRNINFVWPYTKKQWQWKFSNAAKFTYVGCDLQTRTKERANIIRQDRWNLLHSIIAHPPTRVVHFTLQQIQSMCNEIM